MKYIILIAALLAPLANAGVLVIGDSMSAQSTSWPTYYREYTGDNVMVMAQNGRTIRDFTLPNDLKADGNIDKVYYLLGGNDAFQSTPTNLLANRVLSQLRFLKDRGFDVTVILVPEFANKERQVRRVNNVLKKKAAGLRIKTIDLMAVWDTSLTSDTVHPLPALSRIIADYIVSS